MTKNEITFHEWLSALDNISHECDSWPTVSDLARESGCSQRAIQRKIETGIQDGTVKVGRKRKLDTAGRHQLVPCYKFLRSK